MKCLSRCMEQGLCQDQVFSKCCKQFSERRDGTWILQPMQTSMLSKLDLRNMRTLLQKMDILLS
jgi:hypothetical protein